MSFDPTASEGPRHRGAKNLLAELCEIYGMEAQKEYMIESEALNKTYWADLMVAFRSCGKQIRIDLEVEDHDHSKHDFDDAVGKQKLMASINIKTVYFKAADLIGRKALTYDQIYAKILRGIIDGKEENPRMNI